MAERNTTLHLGHELIKAGFDLYAEHPFKMGKETVYLDLLALNYEEKTQIRIEAKRGSGSTAINGIHQDLKKIKSFNLNPPKKRPTINSDYKNKFGIIIDTSWESTFIKWWENPKVEPIKNTKTLTEKEEIGQLINRSNKEDDCVSGTYTLYRSEKGEEDGEKWLTHGMQYLIFELNKKITNLLP